MIPDHLSQRSVPCSKLSLPIQYVLRDFLGQGIDHTLRLARRKERKCARVYNPQPLHPYYSSERINSSHRVIDHTHLVRRTRMPNRSAR